MQILNEVYGKVISDLLKCTSSAIFYATTHLCNRTIINKQDKWHMQSTKKMYIYEMYTWFITLFLVKTL